MARAANVFRDGLRQIGVLEARLPTVGSSPASLSGSQVRLAIGPRSSGDVGTPFNRPKGFCNSPANSPLPFRPVLPVRRGNGEAGCNRNGPSLDWRRTSSGARRPRCTLEARLPVPGWNVRMPSFSTLVRPPSGASRRASHRRLGGSVATGGETCATHNTSVVVRASKASPTDCNEHSRTDSSRIVRTRPWRGRRRGQASAASARFLELYRVRAEASSSISSSLDSLGSPRSIWAS